MEVRYLMTQEWARFPDDVLWRRSKLGLTIKPEERQSLAVFMASGTDVRLLLPQTGQARFKQGASKARPLNCS